MHAVKVLFVVSLLHITLHKMKNYFEPVAYCKVLAKVTFFFFLNISVLYFYCHCFIKTILSRMQAKVNLLNLRQLQKLC